MLNVFIFVFGEQVGSVAVEYRLGGAGDSWAEFDIFAVTEEQATGSRVLGDGHIHDGGELFDGQIERTIARIGGACKVGHEYAMALDGEVLDLA